ncbi:APC family permease [Roseivirga pacifica]|uniref:APC family permease n=1 Tax=Roseivirga pacifica TaxID=1267423 RepID=UPI003BA9A4D3
MTSSKPKKIGVFTATTLVVGSMIGSGIFTIPSSLAPFGGISLFGWLLAAAGALVLASILSKLSRVDPKTGGFYAYTREAFGDLPAFLVGWGYLVSVWCTNAAIALSFTGYLSVFFPSIAENQILITVVGLSAIWLLTIINSQSVSGGGKVQVVTTVLKVAPLVVVALCGLFFFNVDNFKPFNMSQEPTVKAITMSSALCLFAFLGLETATVPAGSIKRPEKTIPKATMLGTVLVIFIYLFSSFSIFGVLSPTEVENSIAPFSDAAAFMWGDAGRYIIAAGACISTFGALNAWILIQGQVPMGMATDGLMPKFFAKKNRFSAPTLGIIFSSVLVTLLFLLNQSKNFNSLYAFLILLSGVTALFSYLASSIAFAYFASKAKKKLKLNTKTIATALVGALFSIWLIIGSGQEAAVWGICGTLAGVPIFLLKKRQNKK